MPRPASYTPAQREAVLILWAAGKQAPEIARTTGVPAHRLYPIVTAARRRGDARAVLRHPAARAWRPEPILYRSSTAFLAVGLERVRERIEAWAQSEMGRRMRQAIALPRGRISDA